MPTGIGGTRAFAFESVAFIGSTNASNRSSGILTEAVVKTSDAAVVRSAKTFVRDLCRDELSPSRLYQLQKMYRPPRIPGGAKEHPKSRSRKGRNALPRLFIAQLKVKDLPEGSEAAGEQGMKVAKARRKHGRSYVLTDYFRVGKNIVRKSDKVIQIATFRLSRGACTGHQPEHRSVGGRLAVLRSDVHLSRTSGCASN